MFKRKVHIRLDDIIHLVVERTLYLGLEKKPFVTTQINNQKDRQHNGKTKKGQTMIYKHFTENQRESKTNPTHLDVVFHKYLDVVVSLHPDVVYFLN
jgi:hypothetical protein